MLTDELKDEIQQAYRRLLDKKGYQPRAGQRQMIGTIARTLGDISLDEGGRRLGENHICMVEAGTGTGKTIAYMLAALPVALARGKKLVVSTATVLLQEQLMQKDLPDLLQASGIPFSFAIAKGRGRYLCLSQLQRVVSDHDGVGSSKALFEDELAVRLDAESLQLYGELEQAFTSGEWDGDRDSWDGSLDPRAWSRVTTDHHQCTNRACPNFKTCSYFLAREEIVDADVVVANHDLVLADLALGGGALLPPPPQTIYIFDEAHHLTDKALNHFSHNFRLGSGREWLANLPRFLAQISGQSGSQRAFDELMANLPATLDALTTNLVYVTDMIVEVIGETEDRQHRLVGPLPQEVRVLAQNLTRSWSELCLRLDRLVGHLQDRIKQEVEEEKQLLEATLSRVLVYQSRAEAAAMLWQTYATEREPGEAPLARWVNIIEQPGKPDYELYSSPITAAELLPDLLWSSCFAAVLTSATMSTSNDFERIRSSTGLAESVPGQSMPSPFNVFEAATLEVPKGAGDPRQGQQFEELLINQLQALVDPQSATLVIFTARRQMLAVYEELPADLRQIILLQDAYSRRQLLQEHRARIDSGSGSVIFGLASMTEGVDLPGAYVSHVIIVKLPFAVPDDPIGATLSEWLVEQGKDPFWEVSIPDAGLKLKQACGRLLRSQNDTGRITLLDKRVLTQRYGQALLDSLPNYRRVFGEEPGF